MKILTDEHIENLQISPSICVQWVSDAFAMKTQCQLPPKISVHPRGRDFITTMPCLLPEPYHIFGVKVVSRMQGRHPSLRSNLMLFDTISGELKAVMDTNWITAMRTGAVAALAIHTFRNSHSSIYSFVGLGSTAHATMRCLLSLLRDEELTIRLFRYKTQAEQFISDYSSYSNVHFVIVNTMEELVEGTDVLVSCITDAQGVLVENTSLFKPGILVVPIHTRGFQNCDLCFDKVFADDIGHVKGFEYFSQFEYFDEFANVLANREQGRRNDKERILSYNIGIGLHDVYYSYQIYNLLQ